MAGHQCYHCKQWIAAGDVHDCWTTTERALTKDLSEDLQDAWERLRESAAGLGEQRIYASHHSIMFSRKSCYFFVRPNKKYLELCIFLGRPLTHARVRNVVASSRTKFAHMLRVTHRDEVEAPITDWLREAYAFQDAPKPAVTPKAKVRPRGKTRERTRKTTNAKPRARTRARRQPAK